MAPFVACLGPSGVQTTPFVSASWRFEEDASTRAAQAGAQVDIFLASVAGAEDFDPATAEPLLSDSLEGDDDSLTFTETLPEEHYVAYITVTDDEEETATCSTAFSVFTSLQPATRPSLAAAGRLGCGDHLVRLQDRGGGVTRAERVPWASLSYGRRVDEITSARMTVDVNGEDFEACCMALADLKAWKHELSIWRDAEEAWVGPVGDPEFGLEDVLVTARDLFAWMERRNLEHDRSFTGDDLALVFQTYVEDALERDPSPNITLTVYGAGVVGDRQVKAAQKRRAADELRELARSGVDWTAYKREILVAGEELPLAPLPLLTNDMVNEPRLLPRGIESASEVSVVGATLPNSDIPASGSAGGIDPDIGLVQTTINESSIKDDRSCESAAENWLALLEGVPSYIRLELLPSAPVRFADLIPGARWPVALSFACRDVEETLRLQEVSVNATVEDSGVTETVSVTLEPLGATDA